VVLGARCRRQRIKNFVSESESERVGGSGSNRQRIKNFASKSESERVGGRRCTRLWASLICLSLRHQYSQRAAGNRSVAPDVGLGVPGLQRDLSKLLPGAIPHAHTGHGDDNLPEYRNDHHRAVSSFATVAPPGKHGSMKRVRGPSNGLACRLSPRPKKAKTTQV